MNTSQMWQTHKWDAAGHFCVDCGQDDWRFSPDKVVENLPPIRKCPAHHELTEFKPGYHTQPIEKGVLGEPSKIQEEYEEFVDALEQGNTLMALMELSDLYGAMKAFVSKHNLTMDQIRLMSEATERAFKSGARK